MVWKIHCNIIFQHVSQPFSSAFSVPVEFPIMKRELFNRWYSIRAFFIAFILFDVPITFVCTAVYVPISFVMSNQPLEIHRYAIFFVILLGLSFAAQGLGMMFSASLDVTETVTFCSFFLGPFTVFTSALMVSSHAHHWVQWIFHMNFVENAIQGALQPIFGLNRSKVDCNEAVYCHYRYPEEILKDFGTDISYERALFVLWSFAIVFRLVAYWLLKNRINRYRNKRDC